MYRTELDGTKHSTVAMEEEEGKEKETSALCRKLSVEAGAHTSFVAMLADEEESESCELPSSSFLSQIRIGF